VVVTAVLTEPRAPRLHRRMLREAFALLPKSRSRASCRGVWYRAVARAAGGVRKLPDRRQIPLF